MPDLKLTNEPDNNIAVSVPVIKDNDRNYLIVEGDRFRLDFDCKVCQMKVSLDNRASS